MASSMPGQISAFIYAYVVMLAIPRRTAPRAGLITQQLLGALLRAGAVFPARALPALVASAVHLAALVRDRAKMGATHDQSFRRRSRSAFTTTDTELKLIAVPAMTGLSSRPKKG